MSWLVTKWQDAPIPRDQIVLFSTTIDQRIAENHPVRLLDELLAKVDWAPFENDYDRQRGQPAIPPRVLASAILYGMNRRIRSSRQLEYAIGHNIDFIWLVSGRSIDHSTIANFRKRHQDAIPKLHREVVKLAIGLGVVRLSDLFIDGTRVLADANRYRTLTAEKAAKLIAAIDQEMRQELDAMEANDALEDLFADGQSAAELPEHLSTLQQRKAKLQEVLRQCQETDAVRKSKGVDPKKNPFQLPITDPDSRILPNKEGGYAANYTPVIAVEGGAGLIVASCVLGGNAEHEQLVGLVEEVQANYDCQVATVMADAAFSTGANIFDIEHRKGAELLSPHRNGELAKDNPAIRDDPTQPVAESEVDRLPRDSATKTFSPEAFVFDQANDKYYCPAGRPLDRAYEETRRSAAGESVKRTIYQSASCADCPLAKHCRRKPDAKSGRRITRDQYEDVRSEHRAKMSDPEVKARYNQRLPTGERPFAVLKHHQQLRRFLTRGLSQVSIEWGLSVTAYNLSRLMSLTGAMRNEPTPVAQ